MEIQEQIRVKIGKVAIHLALVEGGTFQMGGDQFDREKPIHTVRVSTFYMAKYLVTQKLYKEIKYQNPSRWKGVKRPVERVSWEDAKVFIKILNERMDVQNLAGRFRLPTEAEWEYAARGGKYSQGFEYCGSDDLKQVGWYRENSGLKTKPFGLLLPNELGLYDMSGNVYEWCEDDWHSDYNASDRPDDGSAWVDTPNRGANRVVRGGSAFRNPVYCRPAYRYHSSPDYRIYYFGFRLVFSPSQASPSDDP